MASSPRHAISSDRNHVGVTVTLEHVEKRFGQTTVLNNVSLTIHPGEFVAVVGRSGCGKSTLLRVMSGLEAVSDGELTVNDAPVLGIRPDSRVMFQESRLLPWKSVLDNVKLSLPKLPAKEASEQATNALAQVGLADKVKEWPAHLSGGQQQRVALARALVGDPKLLLFDEPLGALDALTRIEMQRLVERLWQQRQFTAVLVTHDVSEAVMLADRVILIEEGRIALDQTIALARPREHDNDFSYYEKSILQRILSEEPRSSKNHFQI
ncbi:ABC transporter ATP-binding protein [Aureibacillus halotolerans]|uniref:Sulfonate transport system ATP-binding protein n=1 Tax=Aureibacillus halotolerans TaxID=1508390 RepID=A0A4R6TW98_9BACI|nr:ATP-binding cassette domain-containing protein [Aureibacillus halotolerans]TDQ37721.1 sulfonate transport system ATP-binding protein [Aureibacillus halotolerans]